MAPVTLEFLYDCQLILFAQFLRLAFNSYPGSTVSAGEADVCWQNDHAVRSRELSRSTVNFENFPGCPAKSLESLPTAVAPRRLPDTGCYVDADDIDAVSKRRHLIERNRRQVI